MRSHLGMIPDSTRCLARMSFEHGTVPTMSPWPSIEEQSERCSSVMLSSGGLPSPLEPSIGLSSERADLIDRKSNPLSDRPTSLSASGSSPSSTTCAGRGARHSSSQVCTRAANVRPFPSSQCDKLSAELFSLPISSELDQLTGVAAILNFPLDIEVGLAQSSRSLALIRVADESVVLS